jgi:hypothetical protein
LWTNWIARKSFVDKAIRALTGPDNRMYVRGSERCGGGRRGAVQPRDPDGTTTWTSPSGHTYARPPVQLPKDTTSDPLDDPAIEQGDDPPF